jgi:hypothetical protein
MMMMMMIMTMMTKTTVLGGKTAYGMARTLWFAGSDNGV